MPVSNLSICALRISRLTSDGTPDYGNENGALAFCGGIMSAGHEITTETVARIFETDGCRKPLVIKPEEVYVTGVSLTLTMGVSDPRLDEILGVGDIVLDGAEVIGFTMPLLAGCGTLEEQFVAIETWSERVDCESPADPPYKRTVYPKVKATPQGYTNEDGLAQIPFSGVGEANPNFGDGPFHDLTELIGTTGWGKAEIQDTALPTCEDPFGYTELPAAS